MTALDYIKLFLTSLGGTGIGIILGKEILSAIAKIKYLKRKGEIANKIHVTQRRFDEEFNILSELYAMVCGFTEECYVVYRNVLSERESGQQIVDKFAMDCAEFTRLFYRKKVLINKELADLFEVSVKKLNRFDSLAQMIRGKHLDYSKQNFSNLEGYKTCVEEPLAELRAIHDEINVGVEYGMPKLEMEIRKYLDSLEVIK